MASLSDFDQLLFEDNETNRNRMMEAIHFFDEVCNSRYFANATMVLFLNKKDLFEDKIKYVSIGDVDVFRDEFLGPTDYESGIEFLKDKFLDRKASRHDQEVYTHITCALDSHNFRLVFACCKDLIFRVCYFSNGFL